MFFFKVQLLQDVDISNLQAESNTSPGKNVFFLRKGKGDGHDGGFLKKLSKNLNLV